MCECECSSDLSRLPHGTRAQVIDGWKTPSPLRKIERKGEPSLVDCSKNTTPMDPPTAPNGVTKSAPALTPAATGGAPLPSSEEFPVETPAPAASALHSAPCVCRPTPRPHPAFIAQGDADWPVSAKEFPGVKPATAPIGCGARAEPQLLTHPPLARAQGISDRTTPSNPRRKKGRKGASAPIVRTKNTTPVGGSNRFGALLGTDGDEGILGGTGKVPRGSTPSTTNSVLAACICGLLSSPARRSHSQARALLFRARRSSSRRPRSPRSRAMPPAGSRGPMSPRSASLASSR